MTTTVASDGVVAVGAPGGGNILRGCCCIICVNCQQLLPETIGITLAGHTYPTLCDFGFLYQLKIVGGHVFDGAYNLMQALHRFNSSYATFCQSNCAWGYYEVEAVPVEIYRRSDSQLLFSGMADLLWSAHFHSDNKFHVRGSLVLNCADYGAGSGKCLLDFFYGPTDEYEQCDEADGEVIANTIAGCGDNTSPLTLIACMPAQDAAINDGNGSLTVDLD